MSIASIDLPENPNEKFIGHLKFITDYRFATVNQIWFLFFYFLGLNAKSIIHVELFQNFEKYKTT